MQRLATRFHPHWGWILCFTALTHGLLLLNDGVYWDGWSGVYLPMQAGSWERLYPIFEDYGYPIRAYQHWIVGHAPSVIFGHKLWTFLSLLAAPLLVYEISLASRFVNRQDAFLLALISASYPAYQVSVELIMLPYTLNYALFLAGVYLMLIYEGQRPGRALAYRLGALGLLALSFWTYSLLSFFFGFILLWYWRELSTRPGRWWQEAPAFVLGRLDFIALPFLFWAMLQIFFQPTDYYQPRLGEGWLNTALAFWQNGLRGQFDFALGWVLAYPSSLLLGLGAGLWLYRRAAPAWIDTQDAANRGVYLWGLLLGLVLLVLGIIPYMSLGFYPLLSGWWTRHALLLALPVAIILLCTLRLAGSFGDKTWQGLLYVGSLLLLALFSFTYMDNYMAWQGRWVKDRSVMLNLSRHPEWQGVSLFWIDDQYPVGPETRYRHYEWSAFFHQAWGGEAYLGLNPRGNELSALQRIQDGDLEEAYKFYRNLDLGGCQAILQVQRGPRPQSFRDGWGLSLRYWAFKYVLPAHLDDYLGDVTQLAVRPILAPQAQNCPAQRAYLAQQPDLEFMSGGELDDYPAWRAHMASVAAVLDWEALGADSGGLDPVLYLSLLDEALALPDEPQAEGLSAAGFDAPFVRRYFYFQTFRP